MLIKMNKTQLEELYAEAQKQMDQTNDELYQEGIQEYMDDISMEIWAIEQAEAIKRLNPNLK